MFGKRDGAQRKKAGGTRVQERCANTTEVGERRPQSKVAGGRRGLKVDFGTANAAHIDRIRRPSDDQLLSVNLRARRPCQVTNRSGFPLRASGLTRPSHNIFYPPIINSFANLCIFFSGFNRRSRNIAYIKRPPII